jgi:hypothetical protein
MAWNEIGSRGFCGAVPLPESMQEMVVNHQAADARYKLTVTPLQTGTIEHGMIISEHQPTNAMPEQVQAVTLPLDNLQSQTIHGHSHEVNLPELASPHNHINPQPKHNKHKGAR